MEIGSNYLQSLNIPIDELDNFFKLQKLVKCIEKLGLVDDSTFKEDVGKIVAKFAGLRDCLTPQHAPAIKKGELYEQLHQTFYDDVYYTKYFGGKAFEFGVLDYLKEHFSDLSSAAVHKLDYLNEDYQKKLAVLKQKEVSGIEKQDDYFSYFYECIFLGVKAEDFDKNLTPTTLEKSKILNNVAIIQLARIIFQLESAMSMRKFGKNDDLSMIDTFALLCRVYQLAKFEIPKTSNHFNEFILPSVGDVASTVTGSNVLDLIHFEVFNNNSTLVVVKSRVIEQFKLGMLSSIDNTFIESNYIKYNMRIFSKDCEVVLSEMIALHDFKNVIKMAKFFDGITKLSQFPSALKTLNRYQNLSDNINLIDPFDEQLLIGNIRNFNMRLVIIELEKNEIANSELRFLNAIMIVMTKSYKQFTTVIDTFQLKDFVAAKISLKDMAMLILSSQIDVEGMTDLKKTATVISTNDAVLLIDQITDTIADYIKPITIEKMEKDGRVIIEVIGKHMVLSEHLSKIENLLSSNPIIEEVRFVGADIMHVDVELKKEKWHGINIVVYANNIEVNNNVEWDVSGYNSDKNYGNIAGNGENGADGYAGESGGNVLIMANSLQNNHKWIISTNGGAGSTGQSGGKGNDGTDGEAWTLAKLKDQTKLGKSKGFQLDDYMLELAKNGGQVIQNDINECTAFLRVHYGFTFEIITNTGCRVYYVGFMNGFKTEILFIFHGADGKAGQSGGQFGFGGEGGVKGDIENKIKKIEGKDIEKNNETGKNGNNGEGGKFGYAGKNGWDVGYKLRGGNFYNYGEDKVTKLERKFGSKAIDKSVYSYPPDSYVEIATKGRVQPNDKQTVDVNKTTPQRNRSEQAIAKRKKTITEQQITSQYSQLFASKYSNKLVDISIDSNELLQQEFELHHKALSEKTKIEFAIAVTVDQYGTFQEEVIEIQERPKDLYPEYFEKFNKDQTTESAMMMIKSIEADRKLYLTLSTLLDVFKIEKKTDTMELEFSLETDNQTVLNDAIKWFILEHGKDAPDGSFVKKFYDQFIALETKNNEEHQKSSVLFNYELSKCDKSLQQLWIKAQTMKWASDEFEMKVKTNADLSKLYDQMKNLKFEEFDWTSCASNVDVLQLFYDLLMQRYPTFCLSFLASILKQTSNVSVKLTHIDKLMLEKYKVVVLNEINQELKKQSTVKEQPQVDYKLKLFAQTFIRHLKMSNLVDDTISSQELGRMAPYFIENNEEHRQQLHFIVENFLKDINTNYSFLKYSIIRFLIKDSKQIFDDFNSEKFLSENKDHDDVLLIENLKESSLDDHWLKCLQNEKVITAFLQHIKDHGTLSSSVRSLMSRLFKINLRIYANVLDSGLRLMENHNSLEFIIFHMLVTDEVEFVKLSFDDNFLKLVESRLVDNIVNERILQDVNSFTTVKDLDTYVANKKYLKYKDNTSEDSGHKEDTTPFVMSDSQMIGMIVELFDKEQVFGDLTNRLEKISSSVVGTDEVLKNILLRLHNDGIHLIYDELTSVIDTVLDFYNDGYAGLNNLNWIILAYPQTEWLTQITLLLLENQCDTIINQSHRDKWEKELNNIKNKQLVSLFARKLFLTESKSLSNDVIDDVLECVNNFSIVSYGFLARLDIKAWKYAVTEEFWSLKILALEQNKDVAEKTQELAKLYIVELQNNYGTSLVEELVEIFHMKKDELKSFDLNQVLLPIYSNDWLLSESTFEVMRSNPAKDWVNILVKKYTNDGQERTIEQLVEIVKNGTNTTPEMIRELDEYKNIILNMDSMVCGELNKKFKDFTKDDITKWVNEKFDKKSTPKMDLFAVIARVFDLIINKSLRKTSLLSILLFINNKTGMMAQISTGEGKTFIAVACAIVKVMYGEKIDIITSSPVLAKRDALADDNLTVFKTFNITAGHNCDEDVEKRKAVYSSVDVIYGSLSGFQRDYLLEEFYDKKVLGDRRYENVIIDEVDSMLLDKNNNILYLSHELPSMDELESVYLYIWQQLNQPIQSTEHLQQVFSKEFLRYKVLDDIYGVLDKEVIKEAIEESSEKYLVNIIWQSFTTAKLIDVEGRLMKESYTEKEILNCLPVKCPPATAKRLVYFFQNNELRYKQIKIPIYLKPFVLLHLNTWIESAMRAMYMQNEREYIVDVDRSGNSMDINPKIFIIDISTGNDESNSQWDDALHQFLQLKHGCKLTMQNLKAVFISNITFFRLYKQIIGMTGTLGSKEERDNLVENYRVNILTLPTFKSKKFIEMPPILGKDRDDWIKKVSDETESMIQKRAVLLICETIGEAQNLYYNFSKKFKDVDIFLYKRDHEKFEVEILKQRQIIIATNLAGRGTDIKLTKELDSAGGLHVILSYLPTNIRIEQQAFGRASRSGNMGSGRLIIDAFRTQQHIAKPTIVALKQYHKQIEQQRLKDSMQYYKNIIKIEEDVFKMFNAGYKKLSNNKEVEDIYKDTFLQNWAYWLDKNSKLLNVSSDDHKVFEDSLKTFMKFTDNYIKQDFWKIKDVHPATLLKYAKIMTKSSTTKALSALDRIIEEDPLNSAVAMYYKCFTLSKRDTCVTNSMEEQSKLLKKTLQLLEIQKNGRDVNTSIFNVMKKKYEKNVVQILGYEEQNSYNNQIDDKIIYSINEILGYPVFPASFGEPFISNNFVCEDLFKELLRTGVLNKPQVTSLFPPNVLQDLASAYGIGYDILVNWFKDQSYSQIEDISYFEQNLKMNIPLPSRQDLWEILKQQNVFKDEVIYAIINTKSLELFDPSLLQSIRKSIKDQKIVETPVLSEGKESEVFLFTNTASDDENADEEDERDLTFDDNHLQNLIEPSKYKLLEQRGILIYNKKVTCVNTDWQSVKFDKFDSLTRDDFKKTKINADDIEQILKSLIESKTIKESDGDKKIFKLAALYDDFDDIDLAMNSVYINDVRSILFSCFPYRIALQKMDQKIIDKNTNIIIPMASSPHEDLLSDIISNGLLEPARVNEKKYTDVKSLYKKEFTKDEVHKIFNDTKLISKQQNMDQLLEHAVSKGVLTISSGKYKISDFEVKDSNFDGSYKDIEKTVRLILFNYKMLQKKSSELKDHLKQLLSPLVGLECPEYALQALVDVLEKNSEELFVCEMKGWDMVLKVQEKKWTMKFIFRFIAVIVIGLAQFIVGTIIFVLSAGTMALVGKALISEGLGDIIFALSNAKAGHFSWDDYGKKKLKSLEHSLFSLGVGRCFSSGKTVLGLGYKIAGPTLSIGGKQIANMTSMELLKNVGFKAIAKFTFKKVALKAVKKVGTAAAKMGFDYSVELKLISITNTFAEDLTVLADKVIALHKISKTFQELFKVMGNEVASRTIKQQIEDNLKSNKEKEFWLPKIALSVEAMGDDFPIKSQSVKQWIAKLSIAMKNVANVDCANQLLNYVNSFLDNLNLKLQKDLKEHIREVDYGTNDSFVSEMMELLRLDMKEDYQKIIDVEIVEHVMGFSSKKIVEITNETMQSESMQIYNSAKEEQLIKQFEAAQKNPVNAKAKPIFEMLYEIKLLNLMRRTRDPKVVAALIRENVQLNITGVEAIVTALQDILHFNGEEKQIRVVLEYENMMTITFGEEENTVPIILQMIGGSFVNEIAELEGNDCIYQVLCDNFGQLKSKYNAEEFKKQLSYHIEYDQTIRPIIQKGWHQYSMSMDTWWNSS